MYLLTFSYRNITHTVGAIGYDKETKLEDAEFIARNLLNQLEQLPVSDKVTIKP